MLIRTVLAACLWQCVRPFPMFQKRIPNGGSVPIPCQPGEIWRGVGHLSHLGAGPRNPFGLDFARAGYRWTEELCRADSDRDGRSNGVELGDPDCVWQEGEVPRFTGALSHPGICDPWDSPACKQTQLPGGVYQSQDQWLAEICQGGQQSECPALKENGVRNLTLRFPTGSQVPIKETTYMCMIVDVFVVGVPQDQDFHLIAVTPAIENRDLIHHIGLCGCTDETVARPEPYESGPLASESCNQYLYVWTVGRFGDCYGQEAGLRIGRGGYKKIAIQLHWNNPELKAGLTDSSGLVLHYTANLRRHDAGILMVGSSLFYLPPRQPQVTISGTCLSQCTRQQVLGSIIITSAWNHMHYAGTSMSVEVTRNHTHLTYLTDDTNYDFHSIRVFQARPHFELLPGDEIHTRCTYNTSSRRKTTQCGMSAQEEMCFGFVYYYPRQNLTLPICLDKLGVSLCQPDTLGRCDNPDKFVGQIRETTAFKEVAENCESLFPCRSECVEAIVKLHRQEPCMAAHLWEYIQAMLTKSQDGTNFLGRLASCKVEVHSALNQTQAILP